MQKKQIKVRKNFGIGLIIAASFFLFNPDIAIIDIIPDVFGYLLLICGITLFAEVNEKIAEARRLFVKAAICNAVKTGLIVVLFGFVTPREMPVSMLLFTFVMNLFDLIYVIPGYIHFFSGLIFLGERLDGSFVLGRKRYVPRVCHEAVNEKRRARFLLSEERRRRRIEASPSNVEKFRRSTVIFVIFKAVTPVLPEFTSLLNYEYSNSLVNYYDFIYLYRTLAIIILFVVGIFWLVSALRFYIGLLCDRAFVSALKEKYTAEVLPNKVYFAKKHAALTRTLFICAAFFFTNLYFDEVNIIPNIIPAVILAFAAFKIRSYSSGWKLCFISSFLVGAGAFAMEYLRWEFNAEFIKEQIMRNPKAYAEWEKLFYVSISEGAALIISVIAILFVARDIVKRYTGYFTPGTDAFDPERATKELHHELLMPLITTGVFGILSALCVPFYFFAMSIRFEAVWFFDLTLSLVFAFCLMQNLLDITRNINYSHFLSDE